MFVSAGCTQNSDLYFFMPENKWSGSKQLFDLVDVSPVPFEDIFR